MSTLAIIGAGAAGLAAAIAAKRAGAGRVLLLERLPRAGKKLLVTGNGRCNFTNTDLSIEHYHGDRTFAAQVIERFGTAQAIEFFESVGVPPYVEDGRVYPKSESAAGLLDALRVAAEDCELIENFAAEKLRKIDDKWEICVGDGRKIVADAVIVAAGGCASPKFGSDGSGFELFRTLGYEISPLQPALVQLKVTKPSVTALKGIRVRAEVKAFSGGETIHAERGEVLFTDYGLSGIPIFQVTARKPCDTVVLDFIPELSEDDLTAKLERRRAIFSAKTAEDFFAGMLHKRLGNMIFRAAGVEKLSLEVAKFDDKLLKRLAYCLKNFEFEISGRMGFDSAQVTAGGVRPRQFSPTTMESLGDRRLYAAGEVLDVHGDCGGYNLHWAWATGQIAGTAAAQAIREEK